MKHLSETTAAIKAALTDRKPGGGSQRAGAKAPATEPTAAPMTTTQTSPTPPGAKTMKTEPNDVLNGSTHGKFVLFGIAPAERVPNGPAMRGFIEINAQEEGAPLKVNVAAWLKIARSSGTEYLSLKVGNTHPDSPAEFTVGPFYGRLFRQMEGNRARYFGFIEDSEKTGEDANGQGTYATHWQLRLHAKPAVSHDGKIHYLAGGVLPSAQPVQESAPENHLPF